MRSLSAFFTLAILILIISCAKQTAPTGGPRDTIPPIMVSSSPSKGALNVSSKTIDLEFSEHIALANAKEQIIITPDIEKKYEITARKKKVILTLEQPLQPNTTYTFNFRDAIQDITEKNPAVNLKLAFSTGSYIDSLQITGTVKDLIQNKEIKDATVALYESDTFNIFQHKPVYITKTNAKGEFQFENLKNGTFYIYAFEDRNRNLITDSRNENYNYHTTPIELNQNKKDIQLSLIRLDARPIKITSARPYNTYFNIRTSKGLKDYKVQSETGDTLFTTYGENRANIKIYNTFENIDSVAIKFTAFDSLQHQLDTTLYVKFLERKTTPEPFTVSIENSKTIARNGNITLKGKTTKPVASINYDSIFVQVDSATRINVAPNELTINQKTGQFTITKNIGTEHFKELNTPIEPGQQTKSKKPTTQYALNFGKAAFISVELDSSQNSTEVLRPLRYEDTGVITAEVLTSEPNYILQLINKNNEVIQSAVNRPKATFADLQPGEYFIRLIIDRNGDGEWTPGNFFRQEEPEPIIFYANEKKVTSITLKANFELGPMLIKF